LGFYKKEQIIFSVQNHPGRWPPLRKVGINHLALREPLRRKGIRTSTIKAKKNYIDKGLADLPADRQVGSGTLQSGAAARGVLRTAATNA